MSKTQMKNQRGEWVPAIPEPLYIGKVPFGQVRVQCSCGRKFTGRRKYEEHYAYSHIVVGEHPL